ncbi:hypothetical protein QQG74_14725 [Micromonospora sp. FIMYZ51]|uniref:nucleotide disphospho-sugar-binding domain-containing protein n=1 Tax=Micromonospora sp. FIMYZ51 TaxID=3051832 RepID=UPI00311DB2FE
MPATPRFVLVTGGSMGDILPYLGLARTIQALGGDVLLAASPQVAALALGERVPFAPLGVAATTAATEEVRPSRGRRGFLELTERWVVAPLAATTAELDGIVRAGDVIVAHPIQIAGALVATARRLPWLTVSPATWLFPNSERMPLYLPRPSLGRIANRAAWRAFGRTLDRRFLPRVREVAEALGTDLPAASFLGLCRSPTQTLVLTSPLFFDGRTLPPSVSVVGLAGWDQTRVWRSRAPLDRYLDAGEAPIVFRAPPHLPAQGFRQVAKEVCARLGRRGVYIDFAATETGVDGPLYVDRYVPLSLVAARAAVGVHYGGIGTAAAFAHAGRPAVVMPSIVDQFETASVLAALRVGVRLDWHRVDADRLTRAVRAALGLAGPAAELGTRLRAERGLRVAAATILATAAEADLPVSARRVPARPTPAAGGRDRAG